MRFARPTLLYAVFFLGAACANDHDAVQKRLSDLSKDIQRLQTSNDALSERVEGLEAKVTAARAAPRAEAEASSERPPLRVVKLVPGPVAAGSVPGEAEEVAAEERPDAPGQRPVIRLRGGGSGKEGSSAGRSVSLRKKTPADGDDQ